MTKLYILNIKFFFLYIAKSIILIINMPNLVKKLCLSWNLWIANYVCIWTTKNSLTLTQNHLMKADLNRHTIYNVGFYASITTFERIIFQGYSYIKLQQSPFYCLYLLLQPKNGLYHGETHLFVFKLSLSSFAFVLKEN